jgi:nucleotide-binding universal stress UspA family protein
LVAIDGSEGVQRALDCALSLVERLGGRLTAVAVERKPPAYAATIGEVDEVKQEKDRFLRRVLEDAEAQAKKRKVELKTKLLTAWPTTLNAR